MERKTVLDVRGFMFFFKLGFFTMERAYSTYFIGESVNIFVFAPDCKVYGVCTILLSIRVHTLYTRV